jgi:hypothetical protein
MHTVQIQHEKIKTREYFGNQDVDGRIKVKWILEKSGAKEW